MMEINISCSMCGEQLFNESGGLEFYPTRSDGKPHYDLDADLRKIAKKHGWIFEDDVCGDVYCSPECA